MASGRVAYINGEFVPEIEAKISLYDSHNHVGDMVHENTRTFAHKAFKLHEHMERMYNSMAVVQIDCGLTIEEMEEVTLELLRRNEPLLAPDEDSFFIHDVTRGPDKGYAELFPEGLRPFVGIYMYPLKTFIGHRADFYDTGVNAVVSRQLHIPTRIIDPKVKSRSRLHYQMAELEMKQWGPDAFAVLLDDDGFLTEGSAANFFLIKDGAVFSAEPRNILRGVTRQTIIELTGELGIPFVEKNLEPYDAMIADEAFFTTTSFSAMPATRFNGQPIGDGKVGPVYRRLIEAFGDMVGVDIIGQAKAAEANLAAEAASTAAEPVLAAR